MKRLLITLLFLGGVVSLGALEPDWWANPHQDDSYDMYERGSAQKSSTEDQAVLSAMAEAKELLVQRIGIVPALKEAGIPPSPEYALVDCQVFAKVTEKSGDGWKAWVLVTYPQKNKKELLDRWKASIASIQDLKKLEKAIPQDFTLTLGTVGGRTQYKENEAIVFSLRSDKDCYLVLVDHQSDGATVLLFPNKYHPDALVRGGETVKIPGPDYPSFQLTVGPPFGDDRIEAVASTRKAGLFAQFTDLVSQLPANQEVVVSTRGIFVEGLNKSVGQAQVTGAQWSSARLILSTFR